MALPSPIVAPKRPSLVKQATRDFGRDIFEQHCVAAEWVVERFGSPLKADRNEKRARDRLYYAAGATVEIQTRKRWAGDVVHFETTVRGRDPDSGRWLPLKSWRKSVKLTEAKRREAGEMGAELAKTLAAGRDSSSIQSEIQRFAANAATPARATVPR